MKKEKKKKKFWVIWVLQIRLFFFFVKLLYSIVAETVGEESYICDWYG